MENNVVIVCLIIIGVTCLIGLILGVIITYDVYKLGQSKYKSLNN